MTPSIAAVSHHRHAHRSLKCCPACAKNCENEKDNYETWQTPTDPRVLMVGLLVHPEKRTRRTRQRRGAAPLEQLAPACQHIVSLGQPTTNTEKSMQLTGETAGNQQRGLTPTGGPRYKRAGTETSPKQLLPNPRNCDENA